MERNRDYAMTIELAYVFIKVDEHLVMYKKINKH